MDVTPSPPPVNVEVQSRDVVVAVAATDSPGPAYDDHGEFDDAADPASSGQGQEQDVPSFSPLEDPSGEPDETAAFSPLKDPSKEPEALAPDASSTLAASPMVVNGIGLQTDLDAAPPSVLSTGDHGADPEGPADFVDSQLAPARAQLLAGVDSAGQGEVSETGQGDESADDESAGDDAEGDASDERDQDGGDDESAGDDTEGDERDDDRREDGSEEGSAAAKTAEPSVTDAMAQLARTVAKAFGPFGVVVDEPPEPHRGAIVLRHGDSRATQKLSSDGTNTFTSPSGASVTVRPDGCIVASEGVRLRPTNDGDLEASTPDGFKVTASPGGDLWVETPDGVVRGLGRDGTVSISDGKGSTLVSTPDGNSTTQTLTMPDGTIVTASTDGTRGIARPDGTATTVHPDGTVIHSMPDGSIAVKDPDGDVSITTPDGTTTVIRQDGDVAVYSPDGTVSYPSDNAPGLQRVDTPDLAILKGAADSVRETAQFLWSVSIIRKLVDPEGYNATVEGLIDGICHTVMNPITTMRAAARDAVDAFAKDPFHAAGKLGGDFLLGGPLGKADDAADLAKAGAKVVDRSDAAKRQPHVDERARAGGEVDNASDTTTASPPDRQSADHADGHRPNGPDLDGHDVRAGSRSDGLTTDESEELTRIRTDVFNLPHAPSSSKTTIVGVLILETGERLPIHSGHFGGPWGGTHRGHIARGAESGFTGHTKTHVEGHAAAIMHQRGINKATLLIEKAPCAGCDHPNQRPNISAMLPRDAELVVVDPDTAGVYRSVH